MTATDPDYPARVAAIEAVRELSVRFDDLIPLGELRKGFTFGGIRIPFADFGSGIYRPAAFQGPAALSVYTAPPKAGKKPPYADDLTMSDGGISYDFRTASTDSERARNDAERDNRSLMAAFENQAQMVYFVGVLPAQYQALAPVFVRSMDHERRKAELEVGLPVMDLSSPNANSGVELRAYATREAKVRLHQSRFRTLVLGAYKQRCAVCSLKETALLHAAHILPDRHELGDPIVVNGVSLCAIHHLAYDRNLMGIDPMGVVHIASRLLHEVDGPMLKTGLQGFHGRPLLMPTSRSQRPDPERLEIRYLEFQAASA